MENDIYYLLKEIAVEAVRAESPCDWCYGVIASTAPLTVIIYDRLSIDDDFIEFGSRKKENLKIGDKLILLRKAGGQFFLCLDVIKEGD